jgi:hypothetical protein
VWLAAGGSALAFQPVGNDAQRGSPFISKRRMVSIEYLGMLGATLTLNAPGHNPITCDDSAD